VSTRRTRHHEAFIGLLYAFGMSAAVLVLSRAPRGAEELQHLVAADILFVPMSAVLETAVLYAVIGAVLALTLGRLRGLWRELAFFGTFSLTVTSSVNLAGPGGLRHPRRSGVHVLEREPVLHRAKLLAPGARGRR
jgi:zinc/manganese transport system permease protein